MKKQKENSHEGITWSEMGKQNVQAEKVDYYYLLISDWSLRSWQQDGALDFLLLNSEKNYCFCVICQTHLC